MGRLYLLSVLKEISGYMIGSDDNMNGNGYFEKSEAAINGATGLPYFWSTMDSCNNGQ